MYGMCHIPLLYIAHVTYTKKISPPPPPLPHFEISVSAPVLITTANNKNVWYVPTCVVPREYK